MKSLKQPKELKVLIYQFREEDTKGPEFECLKRISGFEEDQLTIVDTLTTAPRAEDLASHDLFLLPGCGSFSVAKGDLPHWPELLEVVRTAAAQNMPIFGICFGAQILAAALGGRVEYQPEDQEMGSYQVCLTEAGKSDPIFSQLPDCFNTQQGHKDFITKAPDGAVVLAHSEVAPIQAFALPDQNIYATQFHVELDMDSFKERLAYYQALYVEDHEVLQKIHDGLKPSPEASSLLKLFIAHIFGSDFSTETVEKHVD
jgi:GMP synthase (glutamine-hydrolysing)